MKRIALGLLCLLLLSSGCTQAQIQAGRDQVAYAESRNCRRISTQVTRYDSNKGTYRVVGYNYTRVCN